MIGCCLRNPQTPSNAVNINDAVNEANLLQYQTITIADYHKGQPPQTLPITEIRITPCHVYSRIGKQTSRTTLGLISCFNATKLYLQHLQVFPSSQPPQPSILSLYFEKSIPTIQKNDIFHFPSLHHPPRRPCLLPRNPRLLQASPRPLRRRPLRLLRPPNLPWCRWSLANTRLHLAGNPRSLRSKPRPRMAVLQLPPPHGTSSPTQRSPPRPSRPRAQNARFPMPEPERRWSEPTREPSSRAITAPPRHAVRSRLLG